ncbi:hypothetical protein [Solicola sp. PLA-1-18]|uniref:hypothetical protein n=1 Tax=Solicola sp. PLA-1-18 TaxID=3380532 RepID=UPI003B789F88
MTDSDADVKSAPQPGSKPERVGMLVDFDNVFPPNDPSSPNSVKHDLLGWIRMVVEASATVEQIDIRLYGGWAAHEMLSRRGSEVAAMLDFIDPFPLVRPDGQFLRGSISLARGPIGDSSVLLDDTYRRRQSPPRLRLANTPHPVGCQERGHSCPVKILKKFTQKGDQLCAASSCSVTASSAFVVHEQKMVDTLLACDILEIALDSSFASTFVVSGDTDFVPPALLAKRLSSKPLRILAPTRTVVESAKAHLLDHAVAFTEMDL